MDPVLTSRSKKPVPKPRRSKQKLALPQPATAKPRVMPRSAPADEPPFFHVGDLPTVGSAPEQRNVSMSPIDRIKPRSFTVLDEETACFRPFNSRSIHSMSTDSPTSPINDPLTRSSPMSAVAADEPCWSPLDGPSPRSIDSAAADRTGSPIDETKPSSPASAAIADGPLLRSPLDDSLDSSADRTVSPVSPIYENVTPRPNGVFAAPLEMKSSEEGCFRVVEKLKKSESLNQLDPYAVVGPHSPENAGPSNIEILGNLAADTVDGQQQLDSSGASSIGSDPPPISVCFSGWLLVKRIAAGKKQPFNNVPQRRYCALRNSRLTFSVSDVDPQPLADFSISCSNVIFIGRLSLTGGDPNSFQLVATSWNKREAHSSIFGDIKSKFRAGGGDHSATNEPPLEHMVLSADDAVLVDSWLMFLAKSVAPTWLTANVIERTVDQAGYVHVRRGSTANWQNAWAFASGHTFNYTILGACNGDEDDSLFEVDLRKVVEVQVSMHNKLDWHRCLSNSVCGPFLLSIPDSSLSIQCDHDQLTESWRTLILQQHEKQSNKLSEQRLTTDFVPVIVEKCINYISAHGMSQEGLYRKNAQMSEITRCLELFKADQYAVYLTDTSENTVNVVSEALRRFFRQLDEPLLPAALRQSFFQTRVLRQEEENCAANQSVCGGKALEKYHSVVEKLADVNYATLRKLIRHLKEVTERSDANKATVDNLAKVFAPTLFSVEGQQLDGPNLESMKLEFEVLRDLISHCDAVFGKPPRPPWMPKDWGCSNPPVIAKGFLIPIHLFEKDNEPFNVECSKSTKEVLTFAVEHKRLPCELADLCLFEMIRGGQLERPLGVEEKLSSVVIGRWYAWPQVEISDCFLLIKQRRRRDELAIERARPYPFAENVRLAAEFKSAKFKKGSLECQRGRVCYYKEEKLAMNSKSGRLPTPQLQWNVEDLVWFFGAEKKRAPPTRHCLTFVDTRSGQQQQLKNGPKQQQSMQKFFGVTVAFKDEESLHSWMATIERVQGSRMTGSILINA